MKKGVIWIVLACFIRDIIGIGILFFINHDKYFNHDKLHLWQPPQQPSTEE